MEKAEEFEEFLLSQVIDFKFFEYTLYEITEEMINAHRAQITSGF